MLYVEKSTLTSISAERFSSYGEAVGERSEKVSSPMSNWDFNGLGEGIHVGLFSYIHIRIGRNANGDVFFFI
jgi:hypothetical protein